MADLVEDRDADFLTNGLFAADHGAIIIAPLIPPACHLDDACAEDVNELEIGMLDRSFGERNSGVQAAETIVILDVQFALQLIGGMILDNQRRVLEEFVMGGREFGEHRLQEAIELLALRRIHGAVTCPTSSAI